LTYSQEVPRIVSYNRSDYNAARQNWSIVNDCEGNIYVANTDGLLQFNGYKWELISIPRGQIPRTIYLGNDCKVYVAGFQFFGAVNASEKSTPFIELIGSEILGNSNEEIWNIFGYKDNIFLQSFSDFYNYSAGVMTEITTPGNIMLGSNIRDYIYIPKIEGGIYELQNNNLTTVEQAEALPAESKIAALVPYKDNQILIGTQKHGLFIMDDSKLSTVDNPINSQLLQMQINKIIMLKDGGFAIGTILGGLYVTDQDLNILYHINKANGLANNTVLSLYEAHNGDLWVGLDKGINLVNLSNYNQYYYDKDGQLGSVFTSIVYKDILYLGTNQGLFAQNRDGKFSFIKNSQGQIWSLLDIDDNLLVGHNKGTYILNDNVIEKVSDVTGAWCMLPISNRRILQTTYTGIVLLEKVNGKWGLERRLENGNFLISQARLYGYTLIGQHPNYGVSKLKLSSDYTEVLDEYKYSELDSISLYDNVILSLTSDSMGFVLDGSAYDFSDTLPVRQPNHIAEYNFSNTMSFYKDIEDITINESVSSTSYVNIKQLSDFLLVGIDDGYVKVKSEPLKQKLPQLDYVLISGKMVNKNDYTFKATENDISIQCRDTSYMWQQRDVQYKVLGWDNDWYELSSNGLIELLNLDGGTYEIILSSQNGSKSLVTFIIKPHWYESWPGFIIYTLLVIALIFIIRKYNSVKLEKQKNILQNEKNKEIESALIKSENERLEREVKYKSKMLANSTMTLVQKNRMLAELKEVIQKEAQKLENQKFPRQKLFNLIDRNINSDNDWQIFEQNFAAVHEDFLEKLKQMCPQITNGELKLAAYIKMNLASKEIAPLLNISVRSIENKRYRLRKKMNISRENSLKDFLLSL